MPQQWVITVNFQAWAYGCLCQFYLMSRKSGTEYDPNNPGYL
jgi:hypothetical protein